MRCPGLLAVACVAAVVAAPGVAHADRAITGTVVDDATGTPIVDAFVSIAGLEVRTDAAGRFRLGRLPFERLEVVVVAEGYGAYFGAARIGAELTIRLERDVGAEVIRLEGHTPGEPPLRLDAEQIRTQPGAGNDVLRALQSLPGVARTPFGLGGLALRGTAPRDTKVYLDGIEVPLLYHFGGLASFLPTALVDEVALQPGGASVRYGRGLGGVATVTTRTGRGERARVGGELSLIHAAVVGEAPGPRKGSWLVGVRRSYFDAIIRAAELDLAILPRYFDAQVRWESGDGRWMAILFGSDDKITLSDTPGSSGGINTSNVESFLYTSRFARLGLRYRAVRGATALVVVPSIGVDDVDARAEHNGVDKGMRRTTMPLALRAELTTPALGGTLAVGLDGTAQRHAYDMINTPPATPLDPSPDMVVHRSLTRWGADGGAWLEPAWTFAGDRVEVRPGLRADHFGLSRQWTLDPRLSVRVSLPSGVELTSSVGRYHAPPLVTDLDPIFGDRVMLGSAATQVATTAKTIVDDAHEVSATVYYQDLAQLPVDAITAATPTAANGGTESGGLLGISRELVDTQFGSYSYREAIGRGHTYGLELIARRHRGRWSGWLSYTYARSFRVNPARDGQVHPYVLDQPHALTAVASARLGRRWRLGGRFRFTTGNPITPVAGAYQERDGDWVPVDGPLLSTRLPDFVQFDVRLDRTWGGGAWVLYLDLQNIANRANPEGVTYNEDFTRRRYTTGLPIFPSLGVEYAP